MTKPDTGQLAFEQFRLQIRKARATAGRDPRGIPCSGNVQPQRPTKTANPDPRSENPDEIRRETGTKEPSTRPKAPDPEPPAEDPEEREAMDRIHAEEAQQEHVPGRERLPPPPEEDPLDGAEHAEDHPDIQEIPW